MPKRPEAGGYEVNVDRVIESGRITREEKIAILVTAGSARLRLHLQPEQATSLAEGISAAIELMARTPAR